MGTPTGTGEARHKLYSLELARFLAASVVVLAHWLSAVGDCGAHALFGGWQAPAAVAVEYFFVLSGFVMMVMHHGDFARWGAPLTFWWRRGARIYPSYWLVLAATAVYLQVHPGFAAAASYASLNPWSQQDILPQAWTLRYEAAFYLLFGLCLLPYVGRALLALWVLVAAWHLSTELVMYTGGHFPTWLNPGWLDVLVYRVGARVFDVMGCHFLIGLGAGYLYIRRSAGGRWSLALLGGACAVLVVVLPQTGWGADYLTATRPFLLSLAMILSVATALAAMMLALASLERDGHLRLSPLVLKAGALSFPLYIMHTSLQEVLVRGLTNAGLGTAPLYALFGLGLVAIYAAAIALTWGFDQPVQRALRRVTGAGGWRGKTGYVMTALDERAE